MVEKSAGKVKKCAEKMKKSAKIVEKSAEKEERSPEKDDNSAEKAEDDEKEMYNNSINNVAENNGVAEKLLGPLLVKTGTPEVGDYSHAYR